MMNWKRLESLHSSLIIPRSSFLSVYGLGRLGETEFVLALVTREEFFEEANGLFGLQGVERLHVVVVWEALASVGAFEVAEAVEGRGVERTPGRKLARHDEGVVIFERDEHVGVARAEVFEARDAVAEEMVLESELGS